MMQTQENIYSRDFNAKQIKILKNTRLPNIHVLEIGKLEKYLPIKLYIETSIYYRQGAWKEQIQLTIQKNETVYIAKIKGKERYVSLIYGDNCVSIPWCDFLKIKNKEKNAIVPLSVFTY